MAPVIPVVGAIAGAQIAGSAALIGALGTLGAQAVGFTVATAFNFVGQRIFEKKPKQASFTQEARGISTIVRSAVESHKVIYGHAKVSGPLAFVATVKHGNASNGEPKAGDNRFLHMVIPLAGHQVDAILDIYLNDQKVDLDANGFATTYPYKRPDGPGYSYARVKKFLGTADQAASIDMLREVPGWTSAHRLRGIAYLYVRLEYVQEVFPNGIPNVSALVRGKKLLDPRTGLTQYSNNAALCIRDYLAGEYGFDCDAAEIDDDYFIAAANTCDEQVLLRNGNPQRRYVCNGVVDTAQTPLDNLDALLSSVAGSVTYVQGRFRLHPAAYDAPSGAITASMMAGPSTLRTRTPRKELFNAVKGTFIDPTRYYQPTDFAAITNALYEAQDGGERIYRDIELPYTNHGETAQRLSKIALEKARQGMIYEVPVNYSALKFAPMDVVTISDPYYGWIDKPFRILKWNFDLIRGISLVMQEESAASYDWNRGEGTVIDPAPDTNLPDPFTVAPPGLLTVSESKYVTRAGDGVKAKATLSWVDSPDAFLREYQAEYKLADATEWIALAKTTATTQDVEDIAPGAYDFRVRAFNQMGVPSAYSTAPKSITGLLDPPPAPAGLTISTIGGLAILRWQEYAGNDALDVKIGGKLAFRHSPDLGAGWAQSTTIGESVPGSSNIAILPLKPGIYLAKAVDSSGIESASPSSITTLQATALAYADVDSLTEDPTFPGAKTGVVVDSGALKLSGSGAFDGIPDLDAVLDIDAYGGTTVSGTYEFSGAMDLGLVQSIRLTSHLVAAITQTFDKIDSRIAPIDDWLSFDGTDAAAGDAVIYARQTDDDPAGSPTWGAWNRLDSGEFTARAFQFKAELMVSDATYNISIAELSVTAEEVA